MRKIKLTQGQVSLVDDDDFEYLSQWKWFAARGSHGGFYAARHVWKNGRQKRIWMHRVLAGPRKEQVVDHINGRSLDNRRKNIRACSQFTNQQNRTSANRNSKSGLLGVSFHPSSGLWRSRAFRNGKSVFCRYFKTKALASKHFRDFLKVYG